MSTNGQIFNVTETTHPSEFQTTAAQAQVEAKTGTIAREVEANAEQAKDAAEEAAIAAQSKGPALTGQTATDRLMNDAQIVTGQAVDQGKQSVSEATTAASAAGTTYLDQAKNLASNAVASAQSYIPPGSGPNGEHTATDVLHGLQVGATAAYNTTVEYASAAAGAAQPHLVKAKDMATNYISGGQATETAPVKSKGVDEV